MADIFTKEDWAWLAGIIEGEGSVYLRKYREGSSGSDYGACLTIVNTDRAIIEKASRICGDLKVKVMPRSESSKSKFPFIKGRRTLHFIRTDDAEKILEILNRTLPFFAGRKKRIAEIVVEFCSNRTLLKKKEAEYHAKEAKLFDLYKQVRS